MKRKRHFLIRTALALFMVLCSTMGWGQLLQWNTYGNTGTETTEPSLYNDANILSSNLTLGAGVTAATNGNRFGGSSWSNTLANSITANDYIEFTVTPKPGFSLTATSFVFHWDSSGTGPKNVALRSSLDSFANDLGAIVPASIANANTINISGIVNIAAPITFRIYGYGASASTGTGGFDINSNIVNVQLIGTTSSVCTTPSASFAATTVNKTTADAPFTNVFNSDNTSPEAYSSSDTNVATVNATTGEVTIVGAGTTTIAVTQVADGTYCEVSESYTLNVTSSSPSLAISGNTDNGAACINTQAAVQNYTITNSGNSSAGGLTVVSDNSQFVVSNLSATTVSGSNGTVTFDVTFTPTSAGVQNATITVQSSTSGSNVATFDITGTGNTPVNPGVAVGNAVVTNDAATLYGEVTSLGSCLASPIVNRGFVYTVFSSPEINGGTYVNEGTAATGAFSVNISGLVPVKTYYYKAFVVDAAGHYYYSPTEGTFTTSLATPVATTATNVTPVGFTANWNVVNGAESYLLEVDEISGSVTPNVTVVGWNFDDENTTADLGTAVNANKTISTNGGTISYSAGVSGQAVTSSDWGSGDGTKFWLISFSSTGMNNLKISSAQRSSNTGPRDFKLQYSLDNSSWTDVPSGNVTVANNFTAGVLSDVVLPAALNNQTLAYLRWVMTSNASVGGGTVTSGTSRIDDIVITGDQGSFTITPVSGSPFTAPAPSTSYDVTGLNPDSNYTYTVKAVKVTVESAVSNTISVTTLPIITWDGSAWSNGTGPDATMPAVIDNDYDGPSFEAASLTVNSGATLTVNFFVRTGDVVNNGTITVANNANFIQTGTFTAGAGSAFNVRRVTKPVLRLGYISWSSPMASSTQTLKEFSYGKLNDGSNQSATGTLDNRFYTYSGGSYVTIPSGNTFVPGQGYQIRTPNDFTTTAQNFQGWFTGTVPNSGNITYDATAISGDYVFLGNPYPGSISALAFLQGNTGVASQTLYVWDSASAMDAGNQYTGNTYWALNPTGTVPFGTDDELIATGQGFFVERGASQNSFNFTNAMRVSDATTGVFQKAGNAVNDKFWLQMESASGAKSQVLMAFAGAGTAGFDSTYDGKLLGEGTDVMYTKAGGHKLVIDAHATFQNNDQFNVFINTSHIQNYTISVVHRLGALAAAGQSVYLKDKATGVITDLTSGNYSFTSAGIGEEDRFEVFFSSMALGTSESVKHPVLVYGNQGTVTVQAAKDIAKVSVYDMSGRLLSHKSEKAKTVNIPVRGTVYVMVVVELTDGSKVSKKVKL